MTMLRTVGHDSQRGRLRILEGILICKRVLTTTGDERLWMERTAGRGSRMHGLGGRRTTVISIELVEGGRRKLRRRVVVARLFLNIFE